MADNDTRQTESAIIRPDDLILVTGAGGFIGTRVVQNLLQRGFRKIRCVGRAAKSSEKLKALVGLHPGETHLEIIEGDLLSREHCVMAARDAAVIYHLAAGRGSKSFPDAVMNSVVTTRNLLEACRGHNTLKRLVSVSSFSVYTNTNKPGGRWLDESCPVESRPERRGDAYCYAKVKQDELVADYGRKFGIPYVLVRPGVVYGPGNEAIHGRIGIGTFGLFLHLGGSNRIPFTYVDNCADAIVLAGIKPGVEGEIFNVVDDDLPTSREFLRQYKKSVRRFRSVYLPHGLSYLLCWLWEKYSHWSEGQLPPTFNRAAWHSFWKKTFYCNDKIKHRLGWVPQVSSAEARARYFDGCKRKGRNA